MCRDTRARYGERGCAGPPSSPERRLAAGAESGAASSVSSVPIEDATTVAPETLARLLQQFLGDGEVDQGRVDVLVPEIGGQVGEPMLRIDAGSIPRQHAMDHKGVTKVMH